MATSAPSVPRSEFEREDFVLPIPPTGQWAHAKQVPPAMAAASFWTDLQPTITQQVHLLRDQGWTPETPLGPTYLTIRTGYALRNDLVQWLLVILCLSVLPPLGLFVLWYRNFRGYEPDTFRVTMRRLKSSKTTPQTLPEGWRHADQVGNASSASTKSPILAAILEIIVPGTGALYGADGVTALWWFGVAVGAGILEVAGIQMRMPGLISLGWFAYTGWAVFRASAIVMAVDYNNSLAHFKALLAR